MYCCAECFSDQKIKDFIIDFNEIGECDYCGSEKINIAPVDEVGPFILEGINRAYEDPVEHVSYESREGGYLIQPSDLYDILNYEEGIFAEQLGDTQMLLDALVSDPSAQYVQKDPYGPPRGASDEWYHWKSFCKLVKTERRYTAFLPGEEEKDPWIPHPKDLMESIIASLAFEHFNIIEKGEKIYRARMAKNGNTFSHEDLTSPPPQNARNNRMSPAGISLFYGALHPKTCISELRPSVGERVIVAEFKAIRDLTVIDLSGVIPEIPSIFSEDYTFGYERWINFIKDFEREISRPIRPMDQEIDYIPTQVFTEFLRYHNFKDIFYFGETDQEKLILIDGLQFRSSLHEGGKNLILFNGPEISIQKNPDDEIWLSYQEFQIYEVKKVIVDPEVISKD